MYPNNITHQQNSIKWINILDQYHGVPSGIFTSDELYSGKSVMQGFLF